MVARIDKVVTSGQFAIDGGSWDVDNNVWLIGDDAEVIVIDAAHDADAILDAIDGRSVLAIILGVVVLCSVLATWLPSVRASRTYPATALRYE